MKTIKKTLNHLDIHYSIEKIAAPETILFLDIETTGFTAKGSYLYLIGCIYYKDNSWNLIQWFAETTEEEVSILNAFLNFGKNFSFLIHFNGNNFDIPFLSQKAVQYNLECFLDTCDGLDLYRRIAPYKDFLRLENCKQKTLEAFLQVEREDTLNGSELINVYLNYIKAPTDFALQALILHNVDDIRGMVSLLPILAYHDLFHKPFKVTKVQANYYKDLNGRKQQELLMKLSLSSALPIPVSCQSNGCYFSGHGKTGNIKVPIYEEEMKYFYSNYKNYYYLPAEDIAIHKSVSAFVDKDHRVQAAAATCYTKKSSLFLRQWGILFEPFFKRDYHSKDVFFELTDEMKADRQLFQEYTLHVLQMMI